MIVSSLTAAMALANAQSADFDALGAAPAVDDRRQEILCGCAAAPAADFILEGLVVDAEITLGPDGRSTSDLQATIFNVSRAAPTAEQSADETRISGRTRVLHDPDPETCGVVFDYGKRYSLRVRRTEEGALQTDYCLANTEPTDAPASDSAQ